MHPRRLIVILILAASATCLQGCIATKIVTVPVKVAYGAGKLAVKGTAAAVRAVVPDKDKKKEEASQDETKPAQPAASKPKPNAENSSADQGTPGAVAGAPA